MERRLKSASLWLISLVYMWLKRCQLKKYNLTYTQLCLWWIDGCFEGTLCPTKRTATVGWLNLEIRPPTTRQRCCAKVDFDWKLKIPLNSCLSRCFYNHIHHVQCAHYGFHSSKQCIWLIQVQFVETNVCKLDSIIRLKLTTSLFEWLRVHLRTYTKNTCFQTRLDYMLRICEPI